MRPLVISKVLRAFILFNIIFLLACLSLSAQSEQDCKVLAPGSDAGFDQLGFCAPVTGRVKYFTFYTLEALSTSSLQVEVDWGEKKLRYEVDSLGYNEDLKAYMYEMPEATYEYLADRPKPKCSYPVTVQAVVNDKVCGSPKQSGTVIVWDKDNANGGKLLLNPKTYYACPGSEVSVNFEDNSSWNCVPPKEKVHINWPSRTTQFVYGTQNTISGTVQVDGEVLGTEALAGALIEHPEKASGPSGDLSKSATITIPATAQVGEVFEVTLNNWNYCNQQPEAPIQEKAIIEIVAKPLAKIRVENAEEEEHYSFCPNEEVRLLGDYTVETGTVAAADVRYDWEVVNLANGEVQEWEDQQLVILPEGFPAPGQQQIKLTVSHRATNAQLCQDTEEVLVNLIDAPTISATLNGEADKELAFCPDDPENFQLEVEFAHTFSSNEDFTYLYQLYKKNSTSNNPDSLPELKSGSGEEAVAVQDTYSATFTEPGRYRLRIVASNNSTGCKTIEENTVVIYEKPLADFAVEGFCQGKPTTITDLSQPSAVPGDQLEKWEWDLHYDEENQLNNTFDVDHTGKQPFQKTFAEAGTYQLALRVSNEVGCSSIKVQTIEVEHMPVASLSSSYAGELICPGDTLSFTNESGQFNLPEQFPEGVSYWLLVSDGVATKEVLLEEGQESLDYNSFYNPNDGVETYTVWLRAKANGPENCSMDSEAISVKVRSGAAAGFASEPVYSPFDPNCSPKTFLFVTNEATRALKAEQYKWTIWQNGQLVEEISRERGGEAPFDSLEYVFENTGLHYLDYEVVLVPEKSGICISPAKNTYRVYPNPWAEFSASPALYGCDSVVFEVKVKLPLGISDFSWEFSSLPSNDAETGLKDDHFFISYKRPAYGEPAQDYSIKLKAKNFYGCQAEWTEQLIVNPVVLHEPEIALTSLTGNGCSPLQADFKNISSGDKAGSIFELYIENVATAALNLAAEEHIQGDLSDAFSYTFQQPGNYRVYLKAKVPVEEGECSRGLSEPVEISVQPDPSISLSVFPAEGCGSFTSTISKDISNSQTNTWTIADAGTGELLFGPVSYPAGEDAFSSFHFENESNQPKMYRIKLRAESAAGCVLEDSTEVRVNPLPKAHFSAERDLCAPYVLEVEQQTAGNPEGMEYSWIWGDGTQSTGFNPPAHAYSNPTSAIIYYDLKLIALSPEGCQSDSTIRIRVHPEVKADFDASVLSGCAPLQVEFINKSVGAVETESGWYVKDPQEGSFRFAGNNLAHYVFENNSGQIKEYEVIYKLMSAGGCVDSVAKVIKVRPQLQADFSVEPGLEVYSGQELKIKNQHVLSGVEYSWNWGDGSAAELRHEEELTYRYENLSTVNHYYELSLTAYDSLYGCSITKKVLITVYPALQLNLAPQKDTVCLPQLPEFSTEVLNVERDYWYVGPKGEVDFSRRLSNIYDAALFPNETQAPITYEVVYVGVSAAGYKDSASAEVVVYPELKPSFTIDGLEKALPGAAFRLTNTSPHAEAWASHWDFGNGAGSELVQPGEYEYQDFGTFTIRLTISNGYCSESYAMEVKVKDAQPSVAFEMDQLEGCWPVTVNFSNTSQFTDHTTYFWDFGDGMGTSTAINPSYTYNQPGNYKVSLHAFNLSGAQNALATAEEVVRVHSMPRADFVVRKEQVYTPDEPVYVANYSERGVWYRWDFGDGTIYEGPDQFEPVHYYQQPGVYDIKLVVQSMHGCQDSLVVEEAVRAVGGGKMSLPNGFTPNTSGPTGGRVGSGGQNDVFYPVIKGGIVRYRMLIYNRWGELVFESRDPELGWDGYYNDRLCKADVYIYKIEAELVDGNSFHKMGDLVLIR